MRKFIIAFVSIIFIIQFSLLFADTYQEGIDLYNQKKYLEAIGRFETSLKDGSANKEDINLYLGNCYLKVGNNKKAIKEYTIAERYGKNKEPVYSNLTVMYFANNNLDNALRYGELLIKENPNNTMHNWLLAQVYMGLNDNRKAREYFKKAIEISNKNYLSYKGLGNICLKDKDYKGAYENFKKSIDIREDYIQGYKNIFTFIPDEVIPNNEYIKLLKKYIELNPDDKKAKEKLSKLTS